MWVQFLPLVRTHELWYIRKPFNYNRKVDDNIGNKIGDNPITRKYGLNLTRERILSEMRHNPNITKAKLVVLLGISNTAADNNIRYLRVRDLFIDKDLLKPLSNIGIKNIEDCI